MYFNIVTGKIFTEGLHTIKIINYYEKPEKSQKYNAPNAFKPPDELQVTSVDSEWQETSVDSALLRI